MSDPGRLTIPADGEELAGFLSGETDGGPLAVFAHGLTNSHVDAPLFGEIQERLLDRGVGVLSFDYYGSGESPGAFQDKTWARMRADTEAAIAFARDELRAAPLLLFGRSVGATVLGFHAKDPGVEASALVSPPIDLVATFGRYVERAKDGYVDLPESLERSGQIRGEWRLPMRFFEELAETTAELRAALKGARNVFLAFAEGDTKVAAPPIEEAFEWLAEPRQLCRIEGGDHYYHGQEDAIADASVDWLLRAVGSTPTGRRGGTG